jgi:hypothetical protein
MNAASDKVTKLAPGADSKARVTLKDGRSLDVTALITEQRPAVALLSKAINPSARAESAVQLNSPSDMPQDGVLQFALKTVVPQKFSPSEKIEVATGDESFHVTLSTADGNLTLQDAQTVLATLDPLKQLGLSAFGPLKFRPVDAHDVSGDWQPLVTLVRVPTLSEVHCVDAADKQCTLSGQKLFLLDSVSSDPQFTNAVKVSEGFVDTSLPIPPPSGKVLYLRLRDDPSVVSTATVPVITGPKSPIGQR